MSKENSSRMIALGPILAAISDTHSSLYEADKQNND